MHKEHFKCSFEFFAPYLTKEEYLGNTALQSTEGNLGIIYFFFFILSSSRDRDFEFSYLSSPFLIPFQFRFEPTFISASILKMRFLLPQLNKPTPSNFLFLLPVLPWISCLHAGGSAESVITNKFSQADASTFLKSSTSLGYV